jgi:hypothetical protein
MGTITSNWAAYAPKMGRCPRWGLVETAISHFGVSALILRRPLAVRAASLRLLLTSAGRSERKLWSCPRAMARRSSFRASRTGSGRRLRGVCLLASGQHSGMADVRFVALGLVRIERCQGESDHPVEMAGSSVVRGPGSSWPRADSRERGRCGPRSGTRRARTCFETAP